MIENGKGCPTLFISIYHEFTGNHLPLNLTIFNDISSFSFAGIAKLIAFNFRLKELISFRPQRKQMEFFYWISTKYFQILMILFLT